MKAITLAVLAAGLLDEKLSVLCQKYGIQSCAFCDDLACGDNTSKEAEAWRQWRQSVLKEVEGTNVES